MRLNRPPTDVHHLTPSTEAGPGEVYRRPVPRVPCSGPNALVSLDRLQISPVVGVHPKGQTVLIPSEGRES